MNYLKIFITICFLLLVSCSVISYEEIESETVGTTVIEDSELSGKQCEMINSPSCEDNELKILLEERSKPKLFLTGSATWYNYDLDIPNGKDWTKSHATIAMRVGTRYKHYKVCLMGTDKCVVAKLTDWGPQERTYKVADLSQYAFSQLADLRKGVILVDIYELDY